MSRIVEYTIVIGIMFVIFGAVLFVIDHSVVQSHQEVLEGNYSDLADRIANAVDECVRFSMAYPNGTISRQLTVPSALRGEGIRGGAQSYYISLTNEKITITSSDEIVAVSTLKTIPDDIIVSGGVVPLDSIAVSYYTDDGLPQIRLTTGEVSVF